jgi:hypothetical protein
MAKKVVDHDGFVFPDFIALPDLDDCQEEIAAAAAAAAAAPPRPPRPTAPVTTAPAPVPAAPPAQVSRATLPPSRTVSTQVLPTTATTPDGDPGGSGPRIGWGGLAPPAVPSKSVPGTFRSASNIDASPRLSTGPVVPKTDRYGFKVTDQATTAEERKRQQQESAAELRREEKWLKMLSQWDSWAGKNRAKLCERVKKGIPDCLRGRAWQLILDRNFEAETITRPSVSGLVAMGRLPCCDTIEVDLQRTLPKVAMFTNKGVRDSLKNVLHAYSNADPELGYVQGMAFIAGMLLLYMDEARAFWCFSQLMSGPHCQTRKLYVNDFAGLKIVNRVWEAILNEKYKKIADNLKANMVMPELYTTSWFLPAFMNLNFPPEVRLRVFDRYVMFGFRAVLSFGLTILVSKQDDLEKKKAGDIFPILQKPETCEELKDWRLVLQRYDKVFLSEKDYERFFKKVEARMFY